MTLFSFCSTIPKGIKALEDFKKEKYLGKWYEIARLENRFERNLDNTTAHYSVRDDGNIKVINKGYNYKKNEWTEAKGKAKFVKNESVAMLKVSFFGPFYGGYNVIALDEEYQYALVAGQNSGYLWLLAREKIIPDSIKDNYLKIAQNYGFPVEKLIWVKQDK